MSNTSAKIPRTGKELICFTSARDIAKAVANLSFYDKSWCDITYICGETTTWNDVVQNLGCKLSITYRSLATIVNDIIEGTIRKDDEKRICAEYELMSCSGALELPINLVLNHKETYFQDIQFRTIEDIDFSGKQ